MIVRPANKLDAPEIVVLTRLASGGLIDFLFQDLNIEATMDEVLITGVLEEQG